MQVFNDNCKLSGIPSGITNAAQPHALNIMPSWVECSSASTICTPSDYNRKVKQTITTNSACSPDYSPTTTAGSYTLRATESITIAAPTGSNSVTINPTVSGYFAIQTMDCPQE